MRTRIFLIFLILTLIASAFGQKPTLDLTFTAIDSASYVQLDSIKVMNRSQGGDTVLYWPDTVLVLDYQVGIIEINNEGSNFQVYQNYPNPVKDQTTITLYVPEKDKVRVIISDMLGRIVCNTERVLESGYHSFKFSPGNGGLFFFTAYWKATNSSIKIISPRNGSSAASSFEYIGNNITEPLLKTEKFIQNFSFSLGNTLLYIGYASGLQTGILGKPAANKTITFQFATNIPCLETPTVTYEGQVYNTIQIFNQCWLKENLNVGTMIPGVDEMEDNGVIEKYCYNNEEDSCDIYGGLYQWDEMMLYTTQQGTQGICPPGWHLPTDEEWKVLGGAVDNQYGIGDPVWNYYNYIGFDAGRNLKSTSGWYLSGNGYDAYGYSVLPSGYRQYIYGNFLGVMEYACFRSSTTYSNNAAWQRVLRHDNDKINRTGYIDVMGYSVCCLKD